MATTKEIGDAGEAKAYELLAGKGYAIIDTKAIIGRVEVDILAQHANRLVLIEVKTRKEDHLDDNFALDREKIFRLSRAADSYIRLKNLPYEAQIDAILITNHRDGSQTLTHLEDIALPPRRRR